MATPIVTAKVIDLNAAREARKARELDSRQPKPAAARVAGGTARPSNLEHSIRRDAVRRAARAAL